MSRLRTLLQPLAREDASTLVLSGGSIPRLVVGAGSEPQGDVALSNDEVLALLFAAGGSRHLEALGDRPLQWTYRAERVGAVSIAVIERAGVVEARFTRVGPPPDDRPPPSRRGAGGSVAPPAHPFSRAARPSAAPPAHPFSRAARPSAAPPAGRPARASVELAAIAEPRGKATGASEPPRRGGARPSASPRAQPEPAPASVPPPARKRSTAGARRARPAGALEQLAAEARAAGASDLHLIAGRPPLFRLAGELAPRGDALDPAAVEALGARLVPERLAARYAADGSADFALELPELGRFRVNVARHRGGVKVSLRLITDPLPTLASLGLPAEVASAAAHHQGLIVITGPTGQGKTSTLAALVGQMNREAPRHIITVEDPVEYLYPREAALVSQREVGTHTRSFASAVKASLREDPDVIVIGELRDVETVRVALSASETGHLVLGTMNTPSAAKAIDRLVDLFPPAEQQQARVTLAGGLRLVLGQRLVPTADGARRAVAVELLPGCVPLWNLIRDDRTFQIPSLQQRGKALGVVRLNDSLAELVRAGTVTLDAARACAESPESFEAFVRAGAAAAPAAATLPGAPAAAPAPRRLGESQPPPGGARGLLERAGALLGRKGPV